MDAGFHSLLYANPRLYDLVFPDADEGVSKMCRAAFARYLAALPRSVLDIGCGTGRHLEALAKDLQECWGVDLLESNLEYARRVRPALHVQIGDMRTVRLGRTFDLVTCFGNAISYALTDDDLASTVATFAAHAHPGSLLILDLLNARSYLEGGGFQERIEGSVDTPEFKATSVSLHTLDRDSRILRRTRVWHLPGQPAAEDYAEYRLLYPEEARQLVEGGGFEVLGVYDNREFRSTDLKGAITTAPDLGGMRGRKLYVFARKR